MDGLFAISLVLVWIYERVLLWNAAGFLPSLRKMCVCVCDVCVFELVLCAIATNPSLPQGQKATSIFNPQRKRDNDGWP